MSDKPHDQEKEIEGHSYDGITELDNPLPLWWLWTFLFTIIFAFIYYIHYEVSGAPTLKQELTTALEEMQKNKDHEPVPVETEESLAVLMKQPERLAQGGKLYSEKCSVCHGAELQGQVGPNLTDHFWIHGKGRAADILKVVREGVPDKGMPTWNQMLNNEEMYSITAFILNKKGTHPDHAKAPQGNPVEL